MERARKEVGQERDWCIDHDKEELVELSVVYAEWRMFRYPVMFIILGAAHFLTRC